MINSISEQFNAPRLLFDLQRGNEIAQTIAGCLNPEVIASRVTDGLVEKFDCAFARIWLLEPDQAVLRLVASSGMYRHISGSFAKVPLGTYKVGKIAQNGVAFLSNNLADEAWVGNRDWAIANHIHGFAGYPLAIQGKVLGVLATFSHRPLEPEFLEVLQTLCTAVSIALKTALQHQQEKQSWQALTHHPVLSQLSLSDQIASILPTARLTLVGTEQPLSLSLIYVLLRAAERLNQIKCAYCRLIYEAEAVTLETILPASDLPTPYPTNWIETCFSDLMFSISALGGALQTQPDVNQRSIQVTLKLPRLPISLGQPLRIRCEASVLQMAFTHLAVLAGLRLSDTTDEKAPLLTDDPTQVQSGRRILWIQHGSQTLPKGIKARITLSTRPEQLREAVAAVMQGQTWGMGVELEGQPSLSERELEILLLLSQGLRDREIASHLLISESTVKFHINSSLAKLKAKTRYQALHQVTRNGWL